MLADRLKDLADSLARDGATIRTKFSNWGETALNLSQLAQQASAVGDDARSMSLRADEALNLQHQPGTAILCGPDGDWVSVPWNVKDINTGVEAKQEADALKKAMDNPKDPHSRELITQIVQSLTDHQNDPAYMSSFMLNGGIDQAVRAGRVLHEQDGTHDGVVLSKDSEKILGQFGQGVSAFFNMESQGKLPMPQPDYLSKLTHPAGGDMWSVGMLFKYGPPGDKWSPNVLSAVSGAMLDWRKSHPALPSYEGQKWAGGLYAPATNNTDDNSWENSLGLGLDRNTPSGEINQKLSNIIANDPSAILMQRLSENADASRQLLAGDKGSDYAKDLVSDHWHIPGTEFDESKWPAAVITAATLDRKNHPIESATAAANVINAGADEYNLEKNKDESDKTKYPIPTEITHALSQVFSAYVPDFANSHRMPNAQIASPPRPGDDPPIVIVGRSTTEAFLSEIMQNKDDAGKVVKSLNDQIAWTASQDLSSQGARTYMQDLAELRGEVSAAGKQVKLNEATLMDAAHTGDQVNWNAIGAGLASVPFTSDIPWKQTTADVAKGAIWVALALTSSHYSTDNAANVESDAKKQFYDDSLTMRIPVVQGLIRSGQPLPQPPGHPEWLTGNITVSSQDDFSAFDRWWTEIATGKQRSLDKLDTDMATSFNNGLNGQ
ncbi:hypothetical protein ACWGCW_40550 [Streptomyces sp. NPDC054933]